MQKLISSSEADKRHLQPKPGEEPRKRTDKGAKLWSEDQLIPLPEAILQRRAERYHRQREAGSYMK
jgi:hypothetical protein